MNKKISYLENKHFTIKNGILLKFKDEKVDKVRIPEGVVSIGEKAFFTSRIRACSHKNGIKNHSQHNDSKKNNIKFIITSKDFAKAF